MFLLFIVNFNEKEVIHRCGDASQFFLRQYVQQWQQKRTVRRRFFFLLQPRSGAPLCPTFMRQNHFFRLKYHTSSATTSTDTITTSG